MGIQEKSIISSLLQAINSGTILSGTTSKSYCHNIGNSTTIFTTFKKTDHSVFKLDFVVRFLFPKTRDLSPAAPPGGFIFPEMTPPKHIFR